MDLFWNIDLVENITWTKNNITVKVNARTIAVNHKATVLGYKQYVWFSKYYITNIIALKNLIEKYQVKYDIFNQIFVVRREDKEKSNT